MAHALVEQLRFTRAEFMRGIEGIDDADARIRLEPMNSIGWNVGHLAWHEQLCFLTLPQEETPFPDLAEEFASGRPGTTPELKRVLSAWRAITAAADTWLEPVSTRDLQTTVRVRDGVERSYGDIIQRLIYHYWFHNGENLAIRQGLGHTDLPQFVGRLEEQAPFRADPEGE